jgi:hypothetical protein
MAACDDRERSAAELDLEMIDESVEEAAAERGVVVDGRTRGVAEARPVADHHAVPAEAASKAAELISGRDGAHRGEQQDRLGASGPRELVRDRDGRSAPAPGKRARGPGWRHGHGDRRISIRHDRLPSFDVSAADGAPRSRDDQMACVPSAASRSAAMFRA